jgi:hypothetical protein
MSANLTASALISLFDTDLGIAPFQAQLPVEEFDASTLYQSGVQDIATSAEAFEVGDVADYGLAFFKNLDASDSVQIGIDDSGFVPFSELKPGEWCIAPLADAPHGKSLGAGSVKVQYAIVARAETTTTTTTTTT